MEAPKQDPGNDMTATGADGTPMTQAEAEQQIVKKFSTMRDEKQKVAQKISEMTGELSEHK